MRAWLAYELAAQSWMASVERLVTLGWGLDGVLRARVPGAVVELGCNAGHTSVWLAACLTDADAYAPAGDAAAPDEVSTGGPRHRPGRDLVLFDSFRGLPAPSGPDLHTDPAPDAEPDRAGSELAGLGAGDLAATEEDVRARFARHGLPAPRIVPGWIEDTAGQLPDTIALAYVDLDFYAPTLTGLRAVWPRLSAGGLLVVDDYADRTRDSRAWNGLPGVKRAVDEFLTGLGLPTQAMRVVPGVADYRATGYLHKPHPPRPTGRRTPTPRRERAPRDPRSTADSRKDHPA